MIVTLFENFLTKHFLKKSNNAFLTRYTTTKKCHTIRTTSTTTSIVVQTRYLSSWSSKKKRNNNNNNNNSIQQQNNNSNNNVSDVEYIHRHNGIIVHPESIGKLIVPGNCVLRENRSTGVIKKQYVELVYGYFWMIKDIRTTNEKPILSNTKLIHVNDSKIFPSLSGLKSLSGTNIDVPSYFIRKNRSQDPAAHCTLVTISFRDFGYQQLLTWIKPFQNEFYNKDRVEHIKLNLSDGWINKWLLRGFIQGFTKRNTPINEHDNTFLYFGSTTDLDNLRDSLRMHNVLPGYVFLLDGLARVRFAGSGVASDEEVNRLIQFAKDLTPILSPTQKSNNIKRNR